MVFSMLFYQPDSFPHKCALLAMKIDCLVLAVILLAIGILVTKVTTRSSAMILHTVGSIQNLDIHGI